MEQAITVSVIIPCYNHGQYLGEALDSIEASTYPYIEVIIVDDGSDNRETIGYIDSCRERIIKNQSVKVLRQKNQGPAAARNNGIKKSTGEIILLLDADDKIDETYIEKGIWLLTKYSDVSMVYPSVQHFGEQNDTWYSQPYNFKLLLHYNYLVVSSLFRKELWEKIGGFDEEIHGYEDWDFWIRAGAIGYQGYWLKEPLFFYRKHNISRLNQDNRQRRKLVRLIKEKNKLIYKKAKKNTGETKVGKSLSQKLASTAVRLGSNAPLFLKNIGRRFVKPIIEKAIRNDNSGGLFQVQTLEETPVDVYIKDFYQYTPNFSYQEVLNQGKECAKNNHEKLSILFIIPWLVVGGADKVNLDLMKKFVAKGHNVYVFSTLPTDHVWHEQFKLVTPYITHLGNWFTEVHELLDFVIDYIHAHSIDIIQMSNTQLGYQVSKPIKKYCSGVQIVDLLHMEEPYYPFDYFRYSVRYKESFNHRIVITPYLKQMLAKKYNEQIDRVSVIPNGIEVPSSYKETRYFSKARKERYTIGFVGRMEEQKLPFDFIKAAREILKEIHNVHFIMVGDGSLLSSVKKLAASFHIEQYIEFLGSRNDAVEIMREHFDVLLAPSLREGLPIVGLEALSLGIPVVATDVPGWQDIVISGQNGYLAPVRDYNEMASYCIKLIHDDTRRAAISEKAYHITKQKYSLEVTSSQYIDLYRSLLNK